MNAQTLERKASDEIVCKPEYKRIVRPSIDLYETNEGFVLLTDLPGVRSADLELTVEKKVLTLKGPVNRPSREGFKHVTSDRPVTAFERRFRLSDEIDRDAIEAELSNGVLKLTLKKIAPAQKKTIEIKSHS